MKQTLLTICLILFALPSWGETLTMDDLVIRNDLYYKKFTDVPFTGETQDYWVNGELWRKQYYKDEKADGLWERYSKDGSLEETRAYKNSERISCKGDCD